MRFDGLIAGLGTSSGVRIVVGMWARSPFGALVDAMVETPDGHRVLIAPHHDVADFIAATYTFDEVRVEPTTLELAGSTWTVNARSLRLTVTTGRRTGVGRLLRVVPPALATAPWWSRLIDPAARVLRPGVRTVGTAGGARHEYYGATDEHAIADIRGCWDEQSLGELRDVHPPVRFGFGSSPRTPALVRITTTIDLP